MDIKNKDWIDKASYMELLAKWRFSAIGDPMFQKETGKYYAEIMNQKKSQSPAADAVAASKLIGWEKK